MRLGIVCTPTYGGSGVVATELGLQLARWGHEVHFISYEKPSRLIEYTDNVYFHEVSHDPYPLFHVQPYALALATKIAEVSMDCQLEVLHVHYAIPHAISALLARQIHEENIFKLVTTLHGTDITLVGQSSSYFPLTKMAIENSDGVTAVSHYLKKRTQEIFKVTGDIEVIANMVDLERFKPLNTDPVKQFLCHIPKGRKIVTHVSNFRPVKRVQDVIAVFHNVSQKVDAHLVLVGDGPDLGAAREQVKELNLIDRVTFWGTQQAVEIIHSGSDVFLLPSAHESFGLSALEAMACGCPVVATSGSGLEEFIASGQEGELSPPKDVSGLSEGVLKVLKNHDHYRQKGLARAQEFDLVKRARIYESYYHQILTQQ